MQLPDPARHDSPDDLLTALNDYVSSAETLLEQKNMVDLAGLDAVVDALCGRVRALPLEQGKAFHDKLGALNDRLTDLVIKMTSAQQAIKDEMEGASTRQKASRAYRKETK